MTDKQLKKLILKEVKGMLNEQSELPGIEYYTFSDALTQCIQKLQSLLAIINKANAQRMGQTSTARKTQGIN